MLNPDFRDMLSALSEHDVDYMVVGAYALAFHEWLTDPTRKEYSTGGARSGARQSGERTRRRPARQSLFGADESPGGNGIPSSLGERIGGVSMDVSGSSRRRNAAVSTVSRSGP